MTERKKAHFKKTKGKADSNLVKGFNGNEPGSNEIMNWQNTRGEPSVESILGSKTSLLGMTAATMQNLSMGPMKMPDITSHFDSEERRAAIRKGLKIGAIKRADTEEEMYTITDPPPPGLTRHDFSADRFKKETTRHRKLGTGTFDPITGTAVFEKGTNLDNIEDFMSGFPKADTKREPSLLDQFIWAINTGTDFMGAEFRKGDPRKRAYKLRDKLYRARRFLLDETVTKFLVESSVVSPGEIVQMLDFARLPFKIMWVECDTQVKMQHAVKMNLVQDDDWENDDRSAFLLEELEESIYRATPYYSTIRENGNKIVVQSPLSMVWSADPTKPVYGSEYEDLFVTAGPKTRTLDPNHPDQINPGDTLRLADIKGVTPYGRFINAHLWPRQADLTTMRMRGIWTFNPDAGIDYQVWLESADGVKGLIDVMDKLTGDLRWVIVYLNMLNVVETTYVSRPTANLIYGNKRKPFLETAHSRILDRSICSADACPL